MKRVPRTPVNLAGLPVCLRHLDAELVGSPMAMVGFGRSCSDEGRDRTFQVVTMNVPWKRVLLGVGLMVYGLFALDWMSVVEMKAAGLKTAVYLGALILSPIFVVLGIWFLRGLQRLVLVPAILLLLLSAFVGPLDYLNRMSPWETQTVLFVHGHFKFLRVEQQVQNFGSFGYRDRTVKVARLAGLFAVPFAFDPAETSVPEWIPVNEDINEANWK
ncbi:MAG: hypothetical protein IPK50_13650 [Fibrobacterota bacterium]|nr:MAG: hypothetical protein IPK50_13650 [Fibrobacterota bacterium]